MGGDALGDLVVVVVVVVEFFVELEGKGMEVVDALLLMVFVMVVCGDDDNEESEDKVTGIILPFLSNISLLILQTGSDPLTQV